MCTVRVTNTAGVALEGLGHTPTWRGRTGWVFTLTAEQMRAAITELTARADQGGRAAKPLRMSIERIREVLPLAEKAEAEEAAKPAVKAPAGKAKSKKRFVTAGGKGAYRIEDRQEDNRPVLIDGAETSAEWGKVWALATALNDGTQTPTYRSDSVDEQPVSVVAEGRAETDPCERGTVGCSVLHSASDTDCETW